MSTVPAAKRETAEPRIAFRGETALWIVCHQEFASTWRVWKGPRTTAALERELRLEAKAGRAAHLELDTDSCSGVTLTLGELLALGVIS